MEDEIVKVGKFGSVIPTEATESRSGGIRFSTTNAPDFVFSSNATWGARKKELGMPSVF